MKLRLVKPQPEPREPQAPPHYLSEAELNSRSPEFRRFYNAYFDVSTWSDFGGCDWNTVHYLEGDDLVIATAIVVRAFHDGIEKWRHADDRRVFSFPSHLLQALVTLKATCVAPMLHYLLQEAPDCWLGELAEASWRFEGNPEAETALLRLLRGRSIESLKDMRDAWDDISRREAAARHLRWVQTNASVNALVRCLDDDLGRIRSAAAHALLEMHGKRQSHEKLMRAVSGIDLASRLEAREALIQLTNPGEIPGHRLPDFNVGHYEANPDYVIYRGDGLECWFHLWNTPMGCILFYGDYLSGPMGRPMPFTKVQQVGIVPRVEDYLMFSGGMSAGGPRLEDKPHPAERLASMPRQIKTLSNYSILD